MDVVENRVTRGGQSDCTAGPKKGHGARQTQYVPHAETRHLSSERKQVGDDESGRWTALTDHARIEQFGLGGKPKTIDTNSNRPIPWAFGHVVHGRERSPCTRPHRQIDCQEPRMKGQTTLNRDIEDGISSETPAAVASSSLARHPERDPAGLVDMLSKKATRIGDNNRNTQRQERRWKLFLLLPRMLSHRAPERDHKSGQSVQLI